jgi:hypothetical protein
LKFCGRLKYENEQENSMKAIIMMHGLPGTGKSFIAEKIARIFPNVVVLKTVKFRDIKDSSPERFDEAILKTREEKDVTYKKLIASARGALLEGKIPILDATFHKRYRRKWVYDLAREMNARLAIISVGCDESVVFERIEQRETDIGSDAFLKSRKAFEIMKEQADVLDEKNAVVKHFDSANSDIEGLIGWLKSILS